MFFAFVYMLFFFSAFFFFFSSRRRHTRLVGDWSSTCALPICAAHARGRLRPRLRFRKKPRRVAPRRAQRPGVPRLLHVLRVQPGRLQPPEAEGPRVPGAPAPRGAVEGGALRVENALKAAFDWKVRRKRAKGIRGEKGQQVIHFRQAFHGRTGYTLSLTNTDPRKTDFFPKFPWPRIENPGLRFPVTPEGERSTVAAEARALDQIQESFARNPDDIAAILIEPIQAEGGDIHFRPEL